jgi:hypothetical protein
MIRHRIVLHDNASAPNEEEQPAPVCRFYLSSLQWDHPLHEKAFSHRSANNTTQKKAVCQEKQDSLKVSSVFLFPDS